MARVSRVRPTSAYGWRPLARTYGSEGWGFESLRVREEPLPMLETRRFKRGLLRAVGELTDINPAVILHPPSPAATRLAAFVAKLVDVPTSSQRMNEVSLALTTSSADSYWKLAT